MSEVNSVSTNLGTSTQDTYTGKVFLWVPEPDVLIASGYTTLLLERRKSPAEPWVERTNATNRITIQSGVYNYFFIDESAKSTYQYRPVLRHTTDPGTNPDSPQTVCDAVDTSFELVLTVQELKERYLYGLDDSLSNDAGVPIPDRVYAHYIRAAIATFEQATSLRILPIRITEYHDYFREDVQTFFAFWTNEFPVLRVEEIALTIDPDNPVVYPTEWQRVEFDVGQINMMPRGNTPLLGLQHPTYSGGRSNKYIPQAFKLTYFAGFGAPGNPIPANFIDIIGKDASRGPLNLGGDLLGGAGIASQSISLDGLSTSFNTTSSSTSAGFGARLIQYEKELKAAMPDIIKYWKGLRMRIV